jgi:hypothetical protein
MPIVHKACGDGTIPEHLCNPCIKNEKGGVRGVAYIEKSLIDAARDSTTGLIKKTVVEVLTWWNTGAESGKIIVVPKTRGTFDGGSPQTGSGYGDVKEITIAKNFTLVAYDPDHKDNESFYEALANAPGAYHVAWRTGSELRISDEPVSIDVVDNTEEDVDSVVDWAATSTWTQSRKTVQIFDLEPVKPIFSCFEVAEEEVEG